jgi:hypothetical protein
MLEETPKDPKERRQAARKLFLTLWDKAVGSPTYDKHEWLRLEELLGLPDRD